MSTRDELHRKVINTVKPKDLNVYNKVDHGISRTRDAIVPDQFPVTCSEKSWCALNSQSLDFPSLEGL